MAKKNLSILMSENGVRMLKSKFEKTGSFKANRVFTDRSDPRDYYDKSLKKYVEGDCISKVLVYYGFGGLGKSKLLKELRTNHNNVMTDVKIKVVSVSLDVYDYNSPVTILMGIRKQFDHDCFLFDYALMLYYIKTGLSTDEMMSKFGKINQTIFDVFSDVISMGLGDVTVPLKYVKGIINKINDKRLYGKYTDILNELNELDEFEIYQRLPYYLGKEIQLLREKKTFTILYLDSYESMLLKLNNSAVGEDSEEWLRELFLSSEGLLMIIGSREMLKWKEIDSGWGEYLDQHILEELSSDDAEYFLKHVPIKNTEVIKQIIKSAKGVPAYLDMCVDLYEHNSNRKIMNEPEYFKMSPDKIVSRYLRHLSEKEKYTAEILSYFNEFNIDIAQYILTELHVDANKKSLSNFLEKSMFQLRETNKFKIYDAVREHLLHQLDKEKNTKITYALLKYLNTNERQDDKISNLECIISHFHEIEISQKLIEELLDCVNLLIDYGNWREIQNVFDRYSEHFFEYPEILSYVNMRFYRREGLIKKGYDAFKDSDYDLNIIGYHSLYYSYLKVQFTHLMGKYDTALLAYRKLLNDHWLIKSVVNLDALMMIKIKFADLLMLKGKFQESLDIIESVIEEKNISKKISIEALRVKGHIYRFNFMFDEAETVYNAIELIVKSNNLNAIGKVKNNLLETNMFYKPIKGLEEGKRSLDINESIGALIELGKTHASLSIVYALMEDYQNAKTNVKDALTIQESTGYKSGILFAKLSNIFIKKRLGEDTEECFSEVCQIQNKLQVYEFLLLPYEKEFEKQFLKFEWINSEVTKEKLNDIRRMML